MTTLIWNYRKSLSKLNKKQNVALFKNHFPQFLKTHTWCTKQGKTHVSQGNYSVTQDFDFLKAPS